MADRMKFIDKKPRPKAVVEEAWLVIPKDHYLVLYAHQDQIHLPAGTKYRSNDKFFEALEFEEDHELTAQLYVTAPFMTRLCKEEDEDEDDFE